MDRGDWVGLAGVVAAVLSAGAAAVVVVLNARHRARQEDAKATADRHEVLIDRQEATIRRMEGVQEQMQRTIALQQNELSRCLGEREGERAWMQRFHDLACSQVAALRKAGHDVEDVPPLPPRTEDCSAEAEYQARSAAQNRKLAGTLRPPPPPAPKNPEET